MNCPVCNVQLQLAERQGVEIDYCPNCRGIWLDRGELDKIIEKSEQQNMKAAPPMDRSYGHDGGHRDHDKHDHHHDHHDHHRRKSFLRDLFD